MTTMQIDGEGLNLQPHPARPSEEFRSVRFDIEQGGDGLTFEGYAAVFNSPTRISGWEGEFDEVIMPGAFARSLRDRTPVLMFEHGQHPLLGSMPLGVITRAEEDSRGLYISARLSDNWLIQPVRDAVRDGAVDGMSFRFGVDPSGEKWTKRSSQVDLRAIHDFRAVPELGPVVFPAYAPTTASVRSLVDRLDQRQTTDLTGRPERGAPGGGDPDALSEASNLPVHVRFASDGDSLALRGIK